MGRMQITLGEHGGPRKTRQCQDSSSLGTAARRLTLSRYVARLKPQGRQAALTSFTAPKLDNFAPRTCGGQNAGQIPGLLSRQRN